MALGSYDKPIHVAYCAEAAIGKKENAPLLPSYITNLDFIAQCPNSVCNVHIVTAYGKALYEREEFVLPACSKCSVTVDSTNTQFSLPLLPAEDKYIIVEESDSDTCSTQTKFNMTCTYTIYAKEYNILSRIGLIISQPLMFLAMMAFAFTILLGTTVGSVCCVFCCCAGVVAVRSGQKHRKKRQESRKAALEFLTAEESDYSDFATIKSSSIEEHEGTIISSVNVELQQSLIASDSQAGTTIQGQTQEAVLQEVHRGSSTFLTYNANEAEDGNESFVSEGQNTLLLSGDEDDSSFATDLKEQQYYVAM